MQAATETRKYSLGQLAGVEAATVTRDALQWTAATRTRDTRTPNKQSAALSRIMNRIRRAKDGELAMPVKSTTPCATTAAQGQPGQGATGAAAASPSSTAPGDTGAGTSTATATAAPALAGSVAAGTSAAGEDLASAAEDAPAASASGRGSRGASPDAMATASDRSETPALEEDVSVNLFEALAQEQLIKGESFSRTRAGPVKGGAAVHLHANLDALVASLQKKPAAKSDAACSAS